MSSNVCAECPFPIHVIADVYRKAGFGMHVCPVELAQSCRAHAVGTKGHRYGG